MSADGGGGVANLFIALWCEIQCENFRKAAVGGSPPGNGRRMGVEWGEAALLKRLMDIFLIIGHFHFL
jgi:hypothetical protein